VQHARNRSFWPYSSLRSSLGLMASSSFISGRHTQRDFQRVSERISLTVSHLLWFMHFMNDNTALSHKPCNTTETRALDDETETLASLFCMRENSPQSTVSGASTSILIAVYGTNHLNGTAQVYQGKRYCRERSFDLHCFARACRSSQSGLHLCGPLASQLILKGSRWLYNV